MSWYLFDQNNSGGRFVVNDKVCHRLFIEAESQADAIDKAEDLGCYWDGVLAGIDCPCCGDRWNKYFVAPINLGSRYRDIEEYAHILTDMDGWTTPDARVYYANGDVKEIFMNSY